MPAAFDPVRRRLAPRAWRDARVCAIAFAVGAAGGCFKDQGLGGNTSLATLPVTTGPAPSTTGAPTTGEGTGSSSETGAPPEQGVAFRLSSLNFVDPHFFVSDAGSDDTGTTGGAPDTCSVDGKDALNNLLNQDIGSGDFSLVIVFETFEPGAEMRLFQGSCARPEGSATWTCSKKQGAQQTVFNTTRVEVAPCSDIDTSVFQPVNVPQLSELPTPCIRTEKLEFSVAVADSVGALNLKDAQLFASPDDIDDPVMIPSGLLTGFLTQASAEDIMVDIPLIDVPNLWAVIDVPVCEADHPDQLPSTETIEINGKPVPGAWLAINFTAERVVYTTP